MWNGELASVCRRHPDLVAVYEAPDGGLALLLRQTLVPLHEERGRWFNETRRAARAAVASLRAAGVIEDVSVLQWRPLPDVAEVLTGWLCCYLGDPARSAQLADIVGARLADREPATAAPHRAGRPGRAAAGDLSPTLLNWYRDMTPCWLAVEPQVRRRLILRTHEWIVEGVLSPMVRGERRLEGVDQAHRQRSPARAGLAREPAQGGMGAVVVRDPLQHSGHRAAAEGRCDALRGPTRRSSVSLTRTTEGAAQRAGRRLNASAAPVSVAAAAPRKVGAKPTASTPKPAPSDPSPMPSSRAV